MYSKFDNNICPYESYYNHQAGSGVGVIYKGTAHQRGHGIGSFLGGLFRSVLPLISKGAKVVGKEAFNAGVGIMSDMIQQNPLDESLRNRFYTATSNLKRKADDKIDKVLLRGAGYKNKRQRLQSIIQSPRSKRRTLRKTNKIINSNYNDIFGNN